MSSGSAHAPPVPLPSSASATSAAPSRFSACNDTIITIDIGDPAPLSPSSAVSYTSDISKQANWQTTLIPKKDSEWYHESESRQAIYQPEGTHITEFKPNLQGEELDPFAREDEKRQTLRHSPSREFLPLSQRVSASIRKLRCIIMLIMPHLA